MPNNKSIIIWRTTWHLLFILNIFFDQSTGIVSTSLTAFYNSKCSKPNRSASLFGQTIRRLLVILKSLIRAFYLAQWFNYLLAALFFKIFFLAAKTSLLALFLLSAITLQLYHVPLLALLLLLRWLFLFYSLWADTWKINSSSSL